MKDVIERGCVSGKYERQGKNTTQLHSQGFIFHNLKVQQTIKYK